MGPLIRAPRTFFGKGPEQIGSGVKKMIGWSENVASALARLTKAAPHFGARGFFVTAGKEVELIEATDHAHFPLDARPCFREVGVASHANGRESFNRIHAHCQSGLQHRHQFAAEMVDDALAGALGGCNQGRVVRSYKSVEHAGRDHAGRCVSSSHFEKIESRTRQGFDEAHLPALKNPQQFVNPFGVVVGLHDQALCADQAACVLPAAGLAKYIKATNMTAYDAPLAEFARGPVHRIYIAMGRRRKRRSDQYRVFA